MKTYVGIYKIPAIWDRLPKEKFLKKDKIDFVLSNNVKEINEHKYRITNTKNNIYFELFKNSIKNVKCDIYHYIFIDESIEENGGMSNKWVPQLLNLVGHKVLNELKNQF